jgi:serine/threonine protein kinase
VNQILRPQQTVVTEFSKIPCEVEQFLGGGGQGEVYKAKLGNASVALKWYFSASATDEQYAALTRLVEQGPPTDKFLWPMELVLATGIPGFGYVMPLREPRFKGIVDMMKRHVEPSFRALATAGFDLTHSYLQLHAKGLCYRDISFGNVFFDPNTGDVCICDNDNVAIDGQAKGGILGTPRFMAPEIVRGEALPSTQTDLFSLAVLLFYMFVVHHPLEGRQESSIRCLDLPAMTKLYGQEPVFIYDPSDDSNRPVQGYHDNAIVFWPIYPQFLRVLFTKAFTDGLRDPRNGRVREGEWRATMIRLRDCIIYCSSCGAENFYDADALRSSGGKPSPCWSCTTDVQLPARIRIEKNPVEKDVVMLNHDTKLFPHHVDDGRRFDFSCPIAEMTRHPTNPNVWGLKNLSHEKWVITTANSVRDIEPGRSVPLAVGTQIHFGRAQGEIRI